MQNGQFSLLSGEEIKELSLIEDSTDAQFRASTYDLSVGDIIPSEGEEFEGMRFSLPAGGMVRVISRESVKLPETITGHVLLKNQLCTQGVLALSIGIIDPGFEGPISSTLINFGRGPCPIEKGTSFLRVSFHRCPASPKVAKALKFTRDTYLKVVKQEVKAYSGRMFLNIDALATDAAGKAFGSFKDGILVWATVATVIIALLAIFAPLGASNIEKWASSDEQRQSRMEQQVEQKVNAKYEGEIRSLNERIDQLNQTIAKAGHKK
jgi:dUTPase